MSTLTLFLALVLAVSAGHKFAFLHRLGQAAARLIGISEAMAIVAAFAAAGLEGTAAVALLLEPTRTGGAMAATALWCGYGALLLKRRGQTLDCGCDLSRRAKRIDAFSICRPFFLAGLALFVAAQPIPFLWTVDAPFAALAMLALWFASAELGALPLSARTR